MEVKLSSSNLSAQEKLPDLNKSGGSSNSLNLDIQSESSTASTNLAPSWQPHPYQTRAMGMMLTQGAVGLFLDPGLGKTSICLATLKVLRQHGFFKKALIIAPLRPMYSTWPGEVYKWAEFNDFTYAVIHGKEKEQRLQADVELYFINPEGIPWLFSHKNLPAWDTLIVDESTKFKDSRTKRFKALKGFLPKFRRRWILTGTPVPNGLLDLFGQIFILDRGRSLGQYVTHYRAEFFMQKTWSKWGWIPQPGAFDRVINRIKPLILQLSSEDYIDMPELTFHNVEVALPERAKEIYEAVESDFIAMLFDQTLVAANAAAAGTKCRQIANGAVYVNEEHDWVDVHDEKLDALEDLMEELNGHPVLVLYEFRHDLERIRSRFPLARDLRSGSFNEIIDSFNAGDVPMLVGHPASMGHGLNLQGACHHVIWFGIPWNLEHYDQAIARVWRQGQKNQVRVYHIMSKDTLDEKVLKVLEKKDRTQQDLLSALA